MICSCSPSQGNPNTTTSNENSFNENPTSTVSESKQGPPADVLKLVKHEVIDKEGTGLVASSFLIPSDWTVQDRLYWVYQDPTLPVRFEANMLSQDGNMGIQVYPDVRAVYSTGPTGTSGYPPPRDIISGMKDLIHQQRKGKNIQFVSQKILGEVSQNIAQGRQHIQSAVIKVSYDENGKSFEEEFYARLETIYVATPSLYGNMESTIWVANGLVSCKAANNQLEKCRKIGETFINSIQISKPFFNRLSQVIQLLSDQVYASIYQAGQISKIISATNDQMIANIDASYRQSQAASDRNNEQFSDYIRGVDRYDESGTEVQLPSGYSNAWVNDKGEYLLSSSPGYNPSDDFYGNWKELRKN